MKILILLFLLCLLLTLYKARDGFTEDTLTKASSYLTDEIKETKDPERRQKLVNANNYIYFIKTLFNENN